MDQEQYRYYKITPAEAAFIEGFQYDKAEACNPFDGEQEDGCFLISEKIYLLLKDTIQFQKVNFEGRELINFEDLKPKLDEGDR